MVIGVLVGIVIVYQVLSTDVADHLREYATFKAVGYPHRFFIFEVLNRRARAPLRVCFGVNAQFPVQLRERSMRSLYRSSDCVRGRAVANVCVGSAFGDTWRHPSTWICDFSSTHSMIARFGGDM